MLRFIVLAAALLSALLQATQRLSAQTTTAGANTFEACRAISDTAARERCYETLLAPQSPLSQSAADRMPGSWRLVRTSRTDGGDDVSVMRTAEMARSDLNLAGLALHCGQNGLEVIVFVVEPFSPRTHPRVTLGSPGVESHFEASVLPGGAALSLPSEATSLANGPWQSQADLPVKIEDGKTTIRGVVPLDGLSAALQVLTADCPSVR